MYGIMFVETYVPAVLYILYKDTRLLGYLIQVRFCIVTITIMTVVLNLDSVYEYEINRWWHLSSTIIDSLPNFNDALI